MDREIEVHIDWNGATRPVGRLWARAKVARQTCSFAYDPACSALTAPGDAAQLWRRMVFNVLISNTDDHLRNHGFLSGPRRLAPLPRLRPQPHARGREAEGAYPRARRD